MSKNQKKKKEEAEFFFLVLKSRHQKQQRKPRSRQKYTVFLLSFYSLFFFFLPSSCCCCWPMLGFARKKKKENDADPSQRVIGSQTPVETQQIESWSNAQRGEGKKKELSHGTRTAQALCSFFSFLPCSLPQVTYFIHHKLLIKKKKNSKRTYHDYRKGRTEQPLVDQPGDSIKLLKKKNGSPKRCHSFALKCVRVCECVI